MQEQNISQAGTSSVNLRRGSPFVVGRALKADETIFGREDVFRYIAERLAQDASVNIVGERRMGKTSVLNHIEGNQSRHLPVRQGNAPLLLGRVDLQSHINNPEQFYAEVLSNLLTARTKQSQPLAKDLRTLSHQLKQKPETDYQKFRQTLKTLQESGLKMRPVILVDEFEKLFESPRREHFPFPDFYDGLRALITEGCLRMVIASREPLMTYFNRDGALSSTFPSYFNPFDLEPLSQDESHRFLLQPSDHPLTIMDAAECWEWGNGHPCHLQAAGSACYQAKAERKSSDWIIKRREQLKAQNCMVNVNPQYRKKRKWLIWAIVGVLVLAAIWFGLPEVIGKPIQAIGEKFDNIAAWLIGLAVIVVTVLYLFGVIKPDSVWEMLRKSIGLSNEQTDSNKQPDNNQSNKN